MTSIKACLPLPSAAQADRGAGASELKNYRRVRHASDFVGPPVNRSNPYLWARIRMGCKVCEDCGAPWHWVVTERPGVTPQINVCGVTMPVRRAMYLLTRGKLPPPGTRATSTCRNQHCCNPELVVARKVGLMISDTFQNGARDIVAVRLQLTRYREKNVVKLQADQVAAVRADTRPAKLAAKDHGITAEYFRRLHKGTARMGTDLGVFAGLLA